MVAFRYDNDAVGSLYYSREIPSLMMGLRMSKIQGRKASIAFESNGLFVFTHGNGPVVGNILYRMARTASELPQMPMDVCVAHSQGGMGYMFQQCFANTLARHRVDREVVSVVTQVEVDPDDQETLLQGLGEGISNALRPPQAGRS